MIFLAFDASTPVITAALAEAGGNERKVLAEISVPSRGASEALLTAVYSCLEIADLELEEIELMVVGIGPGTFTGIRIAAATARSLALATGTGLAKNSTLAALAAPALTAAPEVLTIIDARRGQVFAQLFGADGEAGEILCVRPDELPVGELAEAMPLVVGDGAVRYRDSLQGIGHIPSDISPLHRVSAAGHVFSAVLSPISAEEVVPLYARQPDAEVRREINPWSNE